MAPLLLRSFRMRALSPLVVIALVAFGCTATDERSDDGQATPERTMPSDTASEEGGGTPSAPMPGSSGGASTPATGPCTPIGSTAHVRLCAVKRVGNGPIVSKTTSATLGSNFQGPSVMRVPSWIPNALGDYYMYFAAHDGHYIRLAYASSPVGPWKVHAAGTLSDTQVAPFTNTIASPDLHAVDGTKELRMYFHTDKYPGSTQQWSGVARSTDGLTFTLASTTNIAKYYLRAFEHAGKYYGLQKGWSTAPAELGVSPDGIAPFAFIKTMSQGSVRHLGVLKKGDLLLVFYTRIGDAPESIYLSTIDLRTPPATWDLADPVEVLRPEEPYEGAGFPQTASLKGPATNVKQVRDPFPFEDGGKTFLYYTVAGESGIAVAEIAYEAIAP